MKKEIWKPVVGYEGLYMVSNFGRVYSCKYKKLMKLHDNGSGKGYKYIWGCRNGVKEKLYVHIMVAQAFIDNPNNLPEVNHKDENPHNNFVDNLEWCTHRYNSAYSNNVKVLMYTLDWVFEREWNSLKEIEDELGIPYQNVSANCRGKYESTHGHIFRYKEPQAS